MAYCPNCAVELPADAHTCAKCDAIFGQGWDPLPAPPVKPPPTVFDRILRGLLKLVMVLISGAFLFIGGGVAAFEKGGGWLAVCVVAGAAVVALALFARMRWTVLAMLCAVPLGFASCAANFKWHGG